MGLDSHKKRMSERMFDKISYILDGKQKRSLLLLLLVIFVGALMEVLGVSAILPLINVAINPSRIEESWYLKMIWDVMGYTQINQMMLFLCILLIVVYIAKNLYITFMYNFQYKFIYTNQRLLAVKMMNSYMHQTYLFHVSRNVAILQRNVSDDVREFYNVVLAALQLLSEILVCLVLVIYLLTTDVLTTLVVALLVAVFGVLVGLVFKKILVKKGEENRQTVIKINQWILQSFNGIKEIKVMGRENFFLKHYTSTFERFTGLQRSQQMLSFLPRPVMETVCISGLLLTLVIKIVAFDTDVASFIPTLSVFAIAAFRMLPSFNRIAGFLSAIMFNRASVDALYQDLVEIEELRHEEKRLETNEHALTFQDGISVNEISFRYPNTENWVLENISLKVEPNTSIALIGSSGSGKSTLADVMLGLLEPQKGTVTVDGYDIRECMGAWHKNIGYIPQTIYLTDDTIRSNIAFGVEPEDINEEMMWKSLKEAQLDEFIKSLPEGLDTMVGDRGVKLSGGQRQRIGIARALYQQPKILILDEATSALDNETEKEVMDAIDGLHGNRTMIIIAHRLSTIKNCDRIYEVGNGTITERSHEEIFNH